MIDAPTGSNKAPDLVWNTTLPCLGNPVTGLQGTTNEIFVTMGSSLNTMLFKLNSSGDIQWNSTWDPIDDVAPYGLWYNDSTVYVAGLRQNIMSSYTVVFLTKWDENGTLLWDKSWNVTEDDYCYSISGYGDAIYTCGVTNYSGDSGAFLIKWNATGDVVWNRTWDSSNDQAAFDIWCDPTSIYMVGMTKDPVGTEADGLLVKWDHDGNEIWNTTWNTNRDTRINAIWSDSTFLYTTGNVYNESYYLPFITKFDLDGNLVSNSTWASPWDSTAMAISGSGDRIYSLGYVNVGLPANMYDIFLLEWYTNCSLAAEYIINRTLFDAASVLWTDPSGYLLGGCLDDTGVFIVKWDVTMANINPVITTPDDFTCAAGTIGNVISWTINDTTTGITNYSIHRNGTSIATGTWISGTKIEISMDGLASGVYNFTIIVSDGLGGTVHDTIMITVLNENPIITSPVDIICIYGTTGNAISWNITDNSKITTSYIVYRDGMQIINGTWSNDTQITISIDGLAIGIYNITIVVYDGVGGTAQDTVYVEVKAGATIPQGDAVVLFSLVVGITLVTLIVRKRKNKTRPFQT